jgi:saccharopine dehydrogenase-like NADP-dependent oxidoreductase
MAEIRNVLILGAGKIGAAILELLAATADYRLTIADRDQSLLDRLPPRDAARRCADVTDPAALRALLEGQHAVISALPYFQNARVAQAARDCGVHYFDLTEDVETTRAVRRIADGAATAFMPKCGLAPGFIQVVAYDMTKKFESLDKVHMRVGALPEFPSNALHYNLTWSTDGLINEYLNPCEAIHHGKRVELEPLEGLEQFALDGVTYEAFNTSGGLGTLCDTLAGRVNTLDYKTVRYPGHCEKMRLLIDDLKLGERRELLKDVLEYAIPVTLQDVVLVFVTVVGGRGGRLTQESYAKKVYAAELGGRPWSAIQITTAAAVCAMLDLMREGRIAARGFVRQEDVALADFIANRFGRHYA